MNFIQKLTDRTTGKEEANDVLEYPYFGIRGQGSSVGIATYYGLDGPGSNWETN